MSAAPARLDRTALVARHERRMQLLVPADPALLVGLPLFAGLPEKVRPKVAEKARRYIHLLTLDEGDEVLRAGEYSDSAFYVVDGSVEVVLPGLAPEAGVPAGRPRLRGGAHVPGAQRPDVAPRAQDMLGRGGTGGTVILSGFSADAVPGRRTLLKAGEIFGEMSALSRYAVTAGVRADEPTRVLQIRLPGLRMLLAASKEFKKFLDTRYRERTLAHHLRSVPLLGGLDAPFIERLRDEAALLSFEPGQLIVAEGAPAEALFLVRGGYVKVSVHAGSADLAVTYLRKGDFAGETGLLLDEPWPFSLQALEHVELVQIGREHFRAIVRSYPDVEQKLWAETVARLKARGAAARDPISSEYVQMAMETGLIHGESVLLIDLATCTRCDECVRGCADAHGGEPRFVREGYKYRNWLVPTACYQCTDPVCMMDCPTGAITRAVGTLEVTIDEPTCIGCTNCAQRCPWGNVVMVERGEKRPDGKPVEVASKCDLCLTRPQGPACVQMCPHGSAVRISFKDLERVTATLR